MAHIRKILIANREEIACRVMRTAKDLGIRTVAVYSEANAGAPHVAMADEAVLIGPGPVGQSYLVGEKILAAAAQTGADAIHPGYGFLSENAAFASEVEKAGLTFIGPTGTSIDLMGNKAAAKRLMIDAKVPCVPGYEGEDQSDEVLLSEGEKVGFPLMVKAAAGGGGRGMRLVHDSKDLASAISTARSEAENAFGSGELILEKAIVKPRHVEIQVFADSHGNVVHLGERDCSVQRRHQKVIEEAPCPVMTEALRAAMGEAAVQAAKSIDYRGAGTVEFLLDASGAFYFLEMNTRLQVEHPVTEEITGLDLVALQIKVAEGHELGLTQDDVTLQGHAIEVRLYAEDPFNNFLPSTGTIELFEQLARPGVRYDTGIVSGQEISPFYDPMIAKLITHGESRDVARRMMIEALRETALFGPRTNRDFLIACLENEKFAEGDFSTAFIAEEFGDSGPREGEIDDLALVVMAIRQFLFYHEALKAKALNLPAALTNFTGADRLRTPFSLEIRDHIYEVVVSCHAADEFQVEIGDATHVVQIGARAGARLDMSVNGTSFASHAHLSTDNLFISFLGRSESGVNLLARDTSSGDAADGRNVVAPMHGLVVEVFVAAGEDVSMGERLAIVEAMKMQHEIIAQIDGTVAEVLVAGDQQVAADDLMIRIDANDAEGN